MKRTLGGLALLCLSWMVHAQDDKGEPASSAAGVPDAVQAGGSTSSAQQDQADPPAGQAASSSQEAMQSPTSDTASADNEASNTPSGETPATVATIPVVETRRQDPAPGAGAVNTQVTKLDDVVVTAARRAQGVQDVVGGIHVFKGSELDAKGQDQMAAFLLQTPSVALKESGAGGIIVAVRGVSNLSNVGAGVYSGVSTTGMYLDDVPIQGAGPTPDLGFYDLDHVEVLKGPQGTLYGEGSMGGALRFILNQPNPVLTTFKVDGTLATISDSGFSKGVKGVVNFPIYEPMGLAVRLVGTLKREAGWVDYRQFNEKNANRNNAFTVRGLLAFKPTDEISGQFLALIDQWKRPRFSEIDPREPGYVNTEFEDVKANQTFHQYGLTLHYDFDASQATSVTSYVNTFNHQVNRYPIDENLVDQYTGAKPGMYPIRNEPFAIDLWQRTFSQELRLVSAGQHKFDYVVGLFFRNRQAPYNSQADEPNVFPGTVLCPNGSNTTGGPVSQPPGAPPLACSFPQIPPLPVLNQDGTTKVFTRNGIFLQKQWAIYGEGVYHITDRLDFTAGLRLFTESVNLFDTLTTYNSDAIIYAASNEPIEVSENNSAPSRGALPKASLSWHATPDTMLYGIVSKGFRSAAVNVQFDFGLGKPIVVPDYVWNYEIGTKSTFQDRTLIFNTSAYFIDWRNIQVFATGTEQFGALQIAGQKFLDNAGDAQIHGFEFELDKKFTSYFNAGVAVGYMQSKLTKVAANVTAQKGQTLPNAPRYSGNVFASFSYPVLGQMATFGASYQYVDRQKSLLIDDNVPDGAPLNKFNALSANFSVGSEYWSAAIIGTNLLNERQELYSYQFDNLPAIGVGRPRTISLQLHADF